MPPTGWRKAAALRATLLIVVKTSIYLPEELKRDLEQLAERTGRSEAEITREALETFVAARSRPRPRGGLWRSTDGRSAAEDERMLAQLGFGEE